MRPCLRRFVGMLLPLLWLAPILATRAEYAEIGNAELRRLLAQGTAFIDVRRADEWRRTGVVENSHRITFFDHLGRFDAERWLTRLATVTSPDQPIVLLCETGARSRVIGYWLNHKLGFAQVYNVRDGIADWIGAGLPVVPVAD